MRSTRRIVTVMALGLGVIAPGCDNDNHDDPDNLVVVTMNPGDQNTNVNSNVAIILRFSVAVAPESYSGTAQQILLVDQNNSMMPVTIRPTLAEPASEFVTVTPVTPLAANTTYGVAVREMVRATNGETILTPYAGTFSTGATLVTIPNFPPFLTPNPAPPNAGAPGTFTVTGQLITPRARHEGVLLQSGDVVITGGATPRRVSAGGVTLNSIEVFKRTTGTWVQSASLGKKGMFYPRYGHTATLLGSGQVLLAGGGDERTIWDTAEIYDAATDSSTPLTNKMARSRTHHTATILENGNVLLAGGFSDAGYGGILASMEVFDVPSGTFTIVVQGMTQPRVYHAAVRLANGKVLIAGGIIPWFGLGPVVTSGCDTYLASPTSSGNTGVVNQTGGMNNARMNHTLSLYTSGNAGGMVIVVGGQLGAQTAEVYDPSVPITNGLVGNWALVAANMQFARRAHTTNILGTGKDAGKLMIAGGSPTQPTAGVFYVAPHGWVSTESHNCRFCAATTSAEVFDPFGYGISLGSPYRGIDVTGRFDLTRDGSMNATAMVGVPFNPTGNGGRYYHEAVTLTTGHVLISGGWDCPFCSPFGPTFSGPETALATCELYNP